MQETRRDGNAVIFGQVFGSTPGTRMKHPTTSNFLLDLQKRLCYSFIKVTWRRSQVRSEEASFP